MAVLKSRGIRLVPRFPLVGHPEKGTFIFSRILAAQGLKMNVPSSYDSLPHPRLGLRAIEPASACPVQPHRGEAKG